MTETNNLFNWWKASAVSLLVSDPVSISSSAVGSDVLAHITPHNKDLLLTASNGQYKIDGTAAVTPQTVAMPQTTKYECQVGVAPISIGNSVYLPINYGSSTGLIEYTGEADTNQDKAEAITQHVIKYMPGKCTMLAGNSNLEMIVLRTDGSLDNELFVYEQYTDQKGVRRQEAWSTWTFSGDTVIIDAEFQGDKLSLLVFDNGWLVVKVVEMYSGTSVNTSAVYLDDLLTLTSSTGDKVTLPTDYDETDILVVGGTDTTYPLAQIPFTINGRDVEFTNNASGNSSCEVYIGKSYTSSYQPTRPFIWTDDGISITTDSIRIAKWIVSVVETAELQMHIDSEYYSGEDQTFNSRIVGKTNNLVGEQPFTTGNIQFAFAQRAELANAVFYTEGYLGLTIAGLSWLGQYKKTSRRI